MYIIGPDVHLLQIKYILSKLMYYILTKMLPLYFTVFVLKG
jgi:hypothetical protein